MVVSASSPRALVVLPRLPCPPISGGQKRTLRLLESIERVGMVGHVLTPDQGEAGALAARDWIVEQVPAPAPTLGARVRQHLARRPSPFVSALAQRVSALSPDAAFLHLEHTQSAYYLPAPDRLPTLLSLHNVDSEVARSVARTNRPASIAWLRDWNRALATRTTERRAFRTATRVACVSEADAAAVAHCGGRPLLAPNGVDDELFEVPQERKGDGVALFFGDLAYEPNRRGLKRFLQAGWPEVLRRRPGARLAVAGPGADGSLARRLHDAPSVEMLGVVDDVGVALAAADAVVVPLWEGGGTRLKTLEALAAARPVASTPLGVAGLPPAVGQGAIVREHADDLGAALATLLADRETATRLGAAGREAVRPLGWPAVLGELETLLASWVASDHRLPARRASARS